ncbi:MAG: conjugal transfer protein TraX [Ruminococcus sp.]|nr:conjugal transfer protein TraX [Ruminococcus sp.]
MNEQIIPQKYKIVSGSMLKLIAVITMLIDHTGSVIISCLAEQNADYSALYTLTRTIGRVAFPTYAFLLTEGFVHTHDRKKYGINLLSFALISEIPWNLEHTGKFFWQSQNVFFTLFLGFLGMYCCERYKNDGKKLALSLSALLVVSVILKSDYGCLGYTYILMLYILRDKPVLRNIVGAGTTGSSWRGAAAFVPISLYNGKRGFIRGKAMKYTFYLIYPVHMLILYFIKKSVFGY